MVAGIEQILISFSLLDAVLKGDVYYLKNISGNLDIMDLCRTQYIDGDLE